LITILFMKRYDTSIIFLFMFWFYGQIKVRLQFFKVQTNLRFLWNFSRRFLVIK